ncbi:unnamed protein product [Brassica rapa subsp. narinosa]
MMMMLMISGVRHLVLFLIFILFVCLLACDLFFYLLVVKDDAFRKPPPLRGCEFWFDFRTDVLEESFQIERYCEIVWTILNEKKQVDELVGSSDSDKTLSAATLPDADTSSAKSSLDEDENTSSISDAKTSETKDSTNDTEEADLEARLKPQETEPNDAITVEVAEDGDTPPCSPVLALASTIEEAEEHSCSSFVTHQALENKSPSAISQENNESSTLKPLVESREKANAEDGHILKDQQQKQKQNESLQDIETASEPFTTESLLEMCEEPEKSKRSIIPEAVMKTVVVKEEPIINMLTEARIKKAEESLNPPPGSVVLIKKRKRHSNTSLIRYTKQKGPSVPLPLSASTLDLIDRIRQRGGGKKTIMGGEEEPVILISELHDKTGKELRSIAKELKVTRYYKMNKEDLLQHCIMQLKLKPNRLQ